MSDSSQPSEPLRSKTTVRTLRRKYQRGRKITMATAYDYPSAGQVDAAGFDAILVGDSLAMVVLGHENTLSVTMEEMLHHARAVKRGAARALLVGDLPFMSYQADVTDAVRNAGRYLQEAGMDAVKLEGGERVVPQVRAISEAGMPVMGHLGLTPQSVNALGGWRVQGRTRAAARTLLADARALERAGCFAIVLESVPARLAESITQSLDIPTIGIGAGAATSGQVLVYHDILGLYDGVVPRFVKRYAELGDRARLALEDFRREVESGGFPQTEHTYEVKDELWEELRRELQSEPETRADPAAARRWIRAVESDG